MKTLKLLYLFLAVSAAAIYSCSDDNPIENHANTQSSIALRTTLSEYKKANGIFSQSPATELRFEFVFPVTFSYNTGTVVTVTSLDGLLDILSNETSQLYLSGIEFPFQVIQQTATGPVTSTISNEGAFFALLESSGITTYNDALTNTLCFDIVFPISVNTATGTQEITNDAELAAYMDSANPVVGLQIVFPIEVLYEGQIVTVTNIFDFYEMVQNCDACICTADYQPVCVQTANGTLQFSNACFALCSGYTQNDFVSCSTDCSINNLTVEVGDCNNDAANTYELTVNFTYTNPTSTQFEVRNNSNFLIATYNLADLPVTITHYPNSGEAADFIYVNIVGDPSCVAVQQWSVPCSDSCESLCPTDYNPVCVMTATGPQQFTNECFAICAGFTAADFITCGVAPNAFAVNLGTCFTIDYPVQIQHQGSVVTVHVNGQVLQYYQPAVSAVPAFVYPITTSFNGVPLTINSQAEFENAMANICN